MSQADEYQHNADDLLLGVLVHRVVPAWRGLTNELTGPRLHRGDERSRGSESLRESGR